MWAHFASRSTVSLEEGMLQSTRTKLDAGDGEGWLNKLKQRMSFSSSVRVERIKNEW